MVRRMLKGKVSRKRGHSFKDCTTFVSCTTTHKNDQHWFHRHDALHHATSSPMFLTPVDRTHLITKTGPTPLYSQADRTSCNHKVLGSSTPPKFLASQREKVREGTSWLALA